MARQKGAAGEATHRTSGAMPELESLAQKRRRELEARCVSPDASPARAIRLSGLYTRVFAGTRSSGGDAILGSVSLRCHQRPGQIDLRVTATRGDTTSRSQRRVFVHVRRP